MIQSVTFDYAAHIRFLANILFTNVALSSFFVSNGFYLVNYYEFILKKCSSSL